MFRKRPLHPSTSTTTSDSSSSSDRDQQQRNENGNGHSSHLPLHGTDGNDTNKIGFVVTTDPRKLLPSRRRVVIPISLILLVTVALLSYMIFFDNKQRRPTTVPVASPSSVSSGSNSKASSSPSLSKTSTTTKVLSEQQPQPQQLRETLARHKQSLVYLGTEATNTGWKVDTICLRANTLVGTQQQQQQPLIVYGVGAGEDISWDIGLVTKFNATVFIFDPTEKSIKYTTPIIEQLSKTYPHQISHTPEGMSNKQGTLTFAMPINPDHVSMRTTDLATQDMIQQHTTVTVPVNNLQHWMTNNHHEYLDILKIDIEGSEYDVLESLIGDDFMPFTQLLVEYHDRFLSDRSRHTKLLKSLKDVGFVELWSNNGGQEVGYIKVADLAYCEDGTSERYQSTGH